MLRTYCVLLLAAVGGEGQDCTEVTVRAHNQWVSAVAFSPDGTLIASGSADDTVKLWDAKTVKEIKNLRADGKGITALAFSPDGKRIVSGHWNKTLKIWDCQTGKGLFLLRGHKESVTSVAFSRDGKRLVSGSAD